MSTKKLFNFFSVISQPYRSLPVSCFQATRTGFYRHFFMSLANYFSEPFWSAHDLNSNLPHTMHSLFSLLLISILLIQKAIFLLLLGTVFSYSRFFFGWLLGFDFVMDFWDWLLWLIYGIPWTYNVMFSDRLHALYKGLIESALFNLLLTRFLILMFFSSLNFHILSWIFCLLSSLMITAARVFQSISSITSSWTRGTVLCSELHEDFLIPLWFL